MKTFTGRWIVAASLLLASGLQASAQELPADLVDKAKAEDSTLSYYFILGAEANRPLYDSFKAAYPAAEFEVTGGDPLGLIEKVINEATSGQPVADILQGGPMEDGILNVQRQLGMDYRPANEAKVPDNLKFQGSYVVPDYFTFHIAYNSDLVSAEEAPKTLAELADPKWKGKFGIDVEQIDWFAGQLALLGEEEGIALMKKLAANEPVVFAGAQGYEQLAAGGLPVIVNTFSAVLVSYIDAGAPIAIAKSPVVIAQPDIYIGLKQSDNPETVKLFFEFLFTEEAQKILSQGVYKNPVLPGVPQPPHLEDALADDVERFFVTSENWGNFDERIKLFQSLFVQG